jgi:hypothetical protein
MSVTLQRMTHVDIKQFVISSEYLNFRSEINVKKIPSYYAIKITFNERRLKGSNLSIHVAKVTIFQRFVKFRNYSVILSTIKCVR